MLSYMSNDGKAHMKHETLHSYHTPTAYRGKSYVTRESMIGKLSFFKKGMATASDATIAVLCADTEMDYLCASDVAFSAIAVIFVGRQPSEALCRHVEARTLPLLILGRLDPVCNGKIALLDSRTATLYVDPDLDILSRYARQFRCSSEHILLSHHLLPRLDAMPLDDCRFAPFQNGSLLSYTENGPLSICDGEEALFEALCALAENTIGFPLILPVAVGDLENEEHASSLRTRLRAILRASACGSFCLLLEGLTHADEVKDALALLTSVKSTLAAEGVDYRADLPCGICIESLLLLREMVTCPPVDFLCLDFDRLLCAVLPTYMSKTPTQSLKECFFSYLHDDLSGVSASISIRTLHAPTLHTWKKSDALACKIEAFFVREEYMASWLAWNEEYL